jgi:hypothetical protein
MPQGWPQPQEGLAASPETTSWTPQAAKAGKQVTIWHKKTIVPVWERKAE